MINQQQLERKQRHLALKLGAVEGGQGCGFGGLPAIPMTDVWASALSVWAGNNITEDLEASQMVMLCRKNPTGVLIWQR